MRSDLGKDRSRPRQNWRASRCHADDHGILLVDKPAWMTSHDVVLRLRRWLGIRKMGHCGTLDPFATGLLVITLGRATRISDLLAVQTKRYRFTLRLGEETDTMDPTGRVTKRHTGSPVPEEELHAVLSTFTGTFEQEVPRHSAVKVKGKRLYELTRSGVEVALPKRLVTIHEITLLAYHWPRAEMELVCSKGTYIRRLGSDMGERLRCGAHVAELRRLASGPFRLDQACRLEDLRLAAEDRSWREKLIPAGEALSHLPRVVLEDKRLIRRLLHGNVAPDLEQHWNRLYGGNAEPVRIVDARNTLLALWWPGSIQGRKRLRVFHDNLVN